MAINNSLLGLIGGSNASQYASKAGSKLASSLAHLASGRRLLQASDDVSALSIATSLQSQVSGLRQASGNTAQAFSLAQVADGGLAQIGGILDRLQALSVQANSGALPQSAREGLNREFQQLTQEIDRISGNTSFGSTKLLDGSFSSGSLRTANAPATAATGGLTFTGNIAAGQTINLNGTVLTEGVDFQIGGTTQQTVQNIANAANNNSALSGFKFSAGGSTLNISAKAGGEAGNQFVINQAASTAGASFVVNGEQLAAGVFSLQGGQDNGLSANSVSSTGTASGNLLSTQPAQAATSTANFTSASDIVAGDTISISDGLGGNTTFTFVNGTPATSQEIQIGSTLSDTLKNAAKTLGDFSGTGDFGARQLNFSVEGNSLKITGKADGNPLDVNGAANISVNLATTGGSLSNTALNNGTVGGINTNGVVSSDFFGTIQGFTATQTGVNSVTASVRVGNDTFTANISNTQPGANSTVRFTSANGGFFDVTLSGGNGQAVNNQSDANSFASRLNTAFSTVNFTQNRQVPEFNGTGQLVGAKLSLNSDNFSNLKIDSTSVRAAQLGGGSASVEIKINGETFRSSPGLGRSIGAGEAITLTSASNPSRTLQFTNGSNRIDLSSDAGASSFKAALDRSLGSGGSGGLNFQIGEDAGDTLQLRLGNASSASLFQGRSLDILSADGAASASAVLQQALNSVVNSRAEIGSAQSRLNFAADNISSAIQNQEAARSELSDADFAEESTNSLQAQLQRNLSLSLAAQTNKLSAPLLRLLVQ